MAVAQAPARPRAGGGGRIFIILGVVLALGGFGLAIVLPSLFGGHAPGTGTACPCDLVIYSAKDIPLRTQITSADQLTVKSVPQAYEPSGAEKIDSATKTENYGPAALKVVNNLIAEVDIASGQPLLTSMLARPGGQITGAQAAYLPIPSGYVALALPTSELTGVANYIQPGDYIGIVASAGTGKTGATATVFTQLHVLRVGPANLSVTSASSSSTSNSAAAQVAPTSLTVVVTPCQAELIRWLMQNVQVSYELESFHDYAEAATGPDASCKDFNAAKGVQVTDIVTKFPVFQKALGGQ